MMGLDKMIIDLIMNVDEVYFHECDTGRIYRNGDRKTVIIDLKKLTGKTCLPYDVFKHYNVTSGLSSEYIKEHEIKINKKGQWK